MKYKCFDCGVSLARKKTKRCINCHRENILKNTINHPRYKKEKVRTNKCIDCEKTIALTSIRCRECFKISYSGLNHPKWLGGKPNCIDCGKILSRIGCKRCQKCKTTTFNSGLLHPNYIDGRTSLTDKIRKSKTYKTWRTACFQRDNYTCQECSQIGGTLNVDHIKPFCELLSKFLKKYKQFSPIEDKETLLRLALEYKPFWNINNGRTLCIQCHKKTDTYGGKILKHNI